MLGQGDGWRATELTCRSDPATRAFEERHDWLCVAAVLEGMFAYRSVQGRAVMVPGSLLLGSGGTCFECGHEHGAGDRCVAFHFAPYLVEETAGWFGRQTRAHFKQASLPPLAHLLPIVVQARALAKAPAVFHAEQVALDVLATALGTEQDRPEASPSAREERCIANSVHSIMQGYAERLTIEGLAREAGLGRRRFAAVFRRVVGVSPYRYILNLRLDAAAASLSEHRRSSILDLALEAGFGDLSEFTRAFHARFGMPPGRFRRASAKASHDDVAHRAKRRAR